LRHLDHIAQRYSRADHAKEAAAYRDSIQGGQGGLPAKEKPVPTGKATVNVPTPTTSALRVPKTPHTLAAQLGLSIRTIIIDPGHGGRDPGTMHHGVVEQDITLDIGKRLKTILEKQGYQVHMTRDKSTWVSLADRVRFGRSMKGDLFISIHVNASENPEVAGLETYILDFARTSAASRLAMTENAESGRLGDMDKILTEILTGARTTESRQLAEQIQKNTLQVLKKNKTHTRSGGVKGAPFFVLVGSSMPCVLVEVGYCSHKKEAEHLKDARHRQALAQGIADGVRSYAGSLGKK
jgi:N-acetylmuramoyl-L-alanine amidase